MTQRHGVARGWMTMSSLLAQMTASSRYGIAGAPRQQFVPSVLMTPASLSWVERLARTQAATFLCRVAMMGGVALLLHFAALNLSHDSSTIKLWDMRAIGSGPSKGGRGCLAKLEIEGGGVWAIDWMKLKDGNWIGAVAGMCVYPFSEHLLFYLASPVNMFLLVSLIDPISNIFPRYSGVHVVGLSSTNGAVGGSRLQLLDSNQKIHGDGALVIKFDAANLSSKVSDFDQVYGCSWLPNSGDSAPCLLSCSFYNKMIGMSHWT